MQWLRKSTSHASNEFSQNKKIAVFGETLRAAAHEFVCCHRSVKNIEQALKIMCDGIYIDNTGYVCPPPMDSHDEIAYYIEDALLVDVINPLREFGHPPPYSINSITPLGYNSMVVEIFTGCIT